MTGRNDNDNFTRWMLGIAATAIVTVGGAMVATIMQLREDVAVIKKAIEQYEYHRADLLRISDEVRMHDWRLKKLEVEHGNERK